MKREKRYVPNSRAAEARVRRWKKAPVKLVKTMSGDYLAIVRAVDDEMMLYITKEERHEALEKCGRINKWI